jgi:hypothetical protein
MGDKEKMDAALDRILVYGASKKEDAVKQKKDDFTKNKTDKTNRNLK